MREVFEKSEISKSNVILTNTIFNLEFHVSK